LYYSYTQATYQITWEIKQQAAVSLTKIKALAHTTWATNTLDRQHLKTQLLPFNAVYRYLKQLQIPIIPYQTLLAIRNEET
jgi:hypothetical protein